jgi:hypothetical protein
MYAVYHGAVVGESTFATGWLPPLPDLRDYTTATDKIVEITKKLFPSRTRPVKLATKVDLRPWCSPVEDQGGIDHAARTRQSVSSNISSAPSGVTGWMKQRSCIPMPVPSSCCVT